jgi:hypothetical protein
MVAAQWIEWPCTKEATFRSLTPGHLTTLITSAESQALSTGTHFTHQKSAMI